MQTERIMQTEHRPTNERARTIGRPSKPLGSHRVFRSCPESSAAFMSKVVGWTEPASYQEAALEASAASNNRAYHAGAPSTARSSLTARRLLPAVDVNTEAVVAAAKALVAANPNWTLPSLIATLEGLRGPGVYETMWTHLAGVVPTYREEQAVVQALVYFHLYGDQEAA
jgi:hypothetical protein